MSGAVLYDIAYFADARGAMDAFESAHELSFSGEPFGHALDSILLVLAS